MPLTSAGEAKCLGSILTAENMTLKLYTACATTGGVPTAASIVGDFTEPTFTGYAGKTLSNALGATTWSTPAGTPSVSQYYASAPQSWTSTAGAAQTVLGAFYVGAVSGVFYHAEAFAAGQLYNATTSPTNTFVPKFTLGGSPAPTS